MAQYLDRSIQGDWGRRLQLVLFMAVAILAVILIYWAVRPNLAPIWTGFAPGRNASATRTLWDWLELILLPAALLLAVWWLGRSRAGEKIEAITPAVSYETSQQALGGEHQETRIQRYFDRMSALLLEHNLRHAAERDEVRRLARAQTMTVLWGLNSERKGAAARFLYELQLIQHPDPIISLAGANLSAADLRGANLSEADLRYVRLIRANLVKASLHKTDLAGADLTGADMRGSLPTEAEERILNWVPPNLSRANLNEAILIEATLAETDLTETSMRGTDLDRADLQDAILHRANLQDASLLGARLKRANLSQADLARCDLRKAYCEEAILVGANLREADLSGAEARQANFKDSDLSRANLTGANLARSYFYKSTLVGANFRGANLRGANLSGADLTDASLDKADLRGVYLSGAKVTSKQLKNVFSLEGAVMPNNERMRLRLGVDRRSGDSERYYYYQIADNDSGN